VIRALLAIAAAAIAIYYLWRVRSMPPHKQRSGYIKFLLGLMIALVVVLTLTGRMHWVGAAITGAFVFLRQILPWIIRALPFLNKLREQNTQSGESSIQTNHLSATLDHGSGHIDGEIIEGPHKGWLLSELSIMQLEDLLAHYQTEDEESAELLEAYIDQRRQQADQNSEQQRSANRAASDQSARAEALAILGLDEGSTEDEVVAAHRSLIQKLHPDRGGNDFLAAKINQAKDILLNKN
jgi:hypothetical protein